MMKLFILSVLAFALLAARSVAAEKAEPAKTDTRVFEIRTYYAAPGKMKDLHARFRDHTCKILEKYGMDLIGFWTPTDPKGAEEVLIQDRWPTRAKRPPRKLEDAFRKDADWIKAQGRFRKERSADDQGGSQVLQPDGLFEVEVILQCRLVEP